MRADCAAFDPLLLAMWTYDQLHVRARGEMDDQSHHGNKPAEDRDQLRVLRLPALRVPHDPDADEDPGADADGDEKQVDEATGHAHARESRGGRSHRSYILRAGRAAGRGRGRTLREQIRDREKQRKAGQNLFHVYVLTDFSHPLST